MEKMFKIKERNSTIRTEIIGGLTTFFAMAYIVFVNPNQVAAGGISGWLVVEHGADAASIGQIWNATYIASILVAIIGTLLMAFYAKMPFAQACGMGLNAFFCTTFVAGAFFNGVDVIKGYQAGLVIIFLSGIIFLLLSVTGLREYIAKGMPDCLKKAIPAGIGLFIAFIGFQNVDIIQTNPYTLVQFVDIHGAIEGGAVSSILPALIALLGLIIIAVLGKYGVKANVILGIVITTVIYYLATWTVPSFDISAIGQSFKDFGSVGITGIFQADSWKNAFVGANIGGVFNAIVLIISFCLVDMFDTIGTLYGTASEANMLDEKGDPINVGKCMMADSIGTCSGAILGTSTCTTFVESAAGVGAGARTGFASVITALCFAVCLFLSPLASIIPAAATAPALIYVGILMLRNFGKVDMKDLASAVPAFLTLIMMPLTYSISNGIGIGCIAYTLIALFTGKFRRKDIVVAVISLLFIFRFILVTM